MSPRDVLDAPFDWLEIPREEAFSALRSGVVVVHQTLLGVPAAEYLAAFSTPAHWRYPRFFRKKPRLPKAPRSSS